MRTIQSLVLLFFISVSYGANAPAVPNGADPAYVAALHTDAELAVILNRTRYTDDERREPLFSGFQRVWATLPTLTSVEADHLRRYVVWIHRESRVLKLPREDGASSITYMTISSDRGSSTDHVLKSWMYAPLRNNEAEWIKRMTYAEDHLTSVIAYLNMSRPSTFAESFELARRMNAGGVNSAEFIQWATEMKRAADEEAAIRNP